MTTAPASPKEGLRKTSRSRNITVSLIHGLVFGLCLNVSTKYLPNYEGPGWARVMILAMPWLFLAVSFPILRRIWREDELEKIINRDALAFAGYGLIFVLILFGQLEAAGVVKEFKWDTGYLLLLMIFLLGAGVFWSSRRYR